MGRVEEARAAIGHHLAEIQSVFLPGAKVLLVVDNGDPEESLMMGDANSSSVIALIRYLDALPDDPGDQPVTHVRMPTSAAEAKAMWLIGERWIRDNAPEELCPPPPVAARDEGMGGERS